MKRSALKEMLARHRDEIDALRASCKHKLSDLKVYKDYSVVGRGSSSPRVDIVCRNCGKKKVMFRDHKEIDVKIVKTLKRQKGIQDQRLDCQIQYDWELQ